MCLAIDIGADIEKDGGLARRRWKYRSQRRTIDAWQGSEHHFGGCHSGAGVACRNEARSASLANKAQPHTHGRIALAPHRRRRFLAHADDFRGMNHIDRQISYRGMFFDLALKLLTNLRFTANQENLNPVMTTGENRPLHFRLGSPVGTHRIDCDYGWHSRKGDCNLAGLFGVENLASLVVSAFGTYTVRHLLLVTVGTLGERVGSEKVVSAATSGASFGVPPFWIRH